VSHTHEVNKHFKLAPGIILILFILPFLSIVSSWHEEVPELEEIEDKMLRSSSLNVLEISSGANHKIYQDDDGNGVNNEVGDSEDGTSSRDINAFFISLLFVIGFYYSNFSINDKKGITAKILRIVARIRNKLRYMGKGSQILLYMWSWIWLSTVLAITSTLEDIIIIPLVFLIPVAPLYYVLLFINRGKKPMKSKTTKRQYSQLSTRYTRVVGSDTIDVFNTEQVSNLPPRAYQGKWAVIVSNGDIKIVHSIHSTKNDAVNSLLAHEINLKEKQSNSKMKSLVSIQDKNDETVAKALQQRNIEMARALGRTVEDIEADLADDGVLNFSAGSDAKLAQLGIESKFRKAELIGEGGMANVFRAIEIKTGDIVVWKEAAASRFNPLPEVNRRLKEESKILNSLEHIRIPNQLDYGEIDKSNGESVGVLIMENISGSSLKSDIDTLTKLRKGLDFEEVIKIIKQICEPLEYMADLETPIYHRDIKPHNIIIEPDRGPVIIDFGLAKIVDTEHVSHTQGMSEGWSPPERRQGKNGGFTDVYSLGQILWNMLTGEDPFNALTIEEIMEKLVEREHPEWLAEVILASAQRYDRRIQSVFEFRLRLENEGKMP
jgi:tRNA A-37 threonylcarbamoyl transferase component Bud32